VSYSQLNQILEIPRTVSIITECWYRAELQLQSVLKTYSPDTNEDYVTRRFHEEYSRQLKSASDDGLIEKAFAEDLDCAFQFLQISRRPAQIAEGIIADVTLHQKKTEEETGGDFGLVLIRPKTVELHDSVAFKPYRRGLLCQAKIRRESGKLGEFTENQVKVFDRRKNYSALLIYDFSDVDRRLLKPFMWQLYKAANSAEQVTEWLNKENFPSPNNSEEVITGIGKAKIGTDKSQTIDDYITPSGNISLIVNIDWPPGKGPGSSIQVLSRKETKSKVTQYVRTQ